MQVINIVRLMRKCNLSDLSRYGCNKHERKLSQEIYKSVNKIFCDS